MASVIALGVLFSGCSSGDTPPCEPLKPDDAFALIDRETAALEAHAESVDRMNELYETWSLYSSGVDGATFRMIEKLRPSVVDSLNAPAVSTLVLEYAAISSECERWLDEDYEGEGLTQVGRVWGLAKGIIKDVEATEERANDAADTVRLAETIVRLGEERKRVLEQER